MLVTNTNFNREEDMLEVIKQRLKTSTEIKFAVSFIRFSGLGLLIDPLKEFIKKGGHAQIITSTYLNVTQPGCLEVLLDLLGENFKVINQEIDFHAKFWWFGPKDNGCCWVGSSNMTSSGLMKNTELNLSRSDDIALKETEEVFDSFWQNSTIINKEFIDNYSKEIEKNVLSNKVISIYSPNPAQIDALKNLNSFREIGIKEAAVIAATGIGKTFLAAFDIQQMGADSVLYISHRSEHLRQSLDTIKKVLGSNKSYGLVDSHNKQFDADIVLSTIQSYCNSDKLKKRNFDYIILDEFHHAEAPSYKTLKLAKQNSKFFLGLTATPERQDGLDVLEWCSHNIAYEVRLPEAIERQWLIPFHYFGIADDSIDYKDINWRSIKDIENSLSVQARVDLIYKSAKEYGYDGKKRVTVGFCAGKNHARFMAKSFNEKGETAMSVLGEIDVETRRDIYTRLANENDPLSWIFVSDVLNEGVDIPAINSILMLRPTESSTIFLQQLGRGLRLHHSCEYLTVLDFVGHHNSAWLVFQSIDTLNGGGKKTVISDELTIVPPLNCTVTLQEKTREILNKVLKISNKDKIIKFYKDFKQQLDKIIYPVDLLTVPTAPKINDFRFGSKIKSWLDFKEAIGDLESYEHAYFKSKKTLEFLHDCEKDLQVDFIKSFVLIWAVAINEDNITEAYNSFYKKFPKFNIEFKPLNINTDKITKFKSSFSKYIDSNYKLHEEIKQTLGDYLITEIENRILYYIERDIKIRHYGVLSSPDKFNLHRPYERYEIVRHFGKQYNHTSYKNGIYQIDNSIIIICSLDNSGKIEQHQYENHFISSNEFVWSSQNSNHSNDNGLGQSVVEHQQRGLKIYLFVKHKNKTQIFLGLIDYISHIETDLKKPMKVTFKLKSKMSFEAIEYLKVNHYPFFNNLYDTDSSKLIQ